MDDLQDLHEALTSVTVEDHIIKPGYFITNQGVGKVNFCWCQAGSVLASVPMDKCSFITEEQEIVATIGESTSTSEGRRYRLFYISPMFIDPRSPLTFNPIATKYASKEIYGSCLLYPIDN